MTDNQDQEERHIERIALRALDQALGSRIAHIWNTVTIDAKSIGDKGSRERFKTGVLAAIDYYKAACDGVRKHFGGR